MYEVLSRRFRRAREAEQAAETGGATPDGWKLPDLIVVDGGKGQLAMALAAARDVGIDVRPGAGLPIVALAKERDVALARGWRRRRGRAGQRGRGSARRCRLVDAAAVATALRRPRPRRRVAPAPRPSRIACSCPHAKDAIPIRPNSAEMFVLQQLRDEAHRFAVSFHRGQRRRLTLRSALVGHPRHRPRPPAPAAAPLRQRQARARGLRRGAGRRVRDDPLGGRGRVRALGQAAGRAQTAAPEGVSAEKDAEEQAEQLAIADAFADVEAGDNKQEI